MKIAFFTRVAVITIASTFCATASIARDQLQIAGSSTVLPYAKIVAETFGETFPQFPTPIVESGGSGAGIKQLCDGVGEDTIDIANSSSEMKQTQLQGCFDNGVTEVQEIQIGYDGIVFATDIEGANFELSPKMVHDALAAQIVVEGKLVDNPHQTWHDVDASLPDWKIAAYIPGEKHGTREVFEKKLLEEGCDKDGMTDAGVSSEGKDMFNACVKVRKDGRVIDIDGDYTETLARINANKTGVGVFGLSFYENNADKLKVATVNGILPTTETIASGEYPVSRPLFFYVKKAHIGVIPGLKEYVEFFLDDQMIGPDSPLAEYGLVAAPDAEREAQREKFAAGETM